MIRKGLLSAACVVVLAGVGCQSDKGSTVRPMQTQAMSSRPATTAPVNGMMAGASSQSPTSGSPYSPQTNYQQAGASQPGTIGMPASGSSMGSSSSGGAMPTLPGSLPSNMSGRSDMGGSYSR